MTAARNVWLTTEHGDVVRADGIVAFHLRVPGLRDDSGHGRRPVDAEIWATVEHSQHPVLVVTEAAEDIPALLAGLISALTSTEAATASSLFVRAVPATATGGGGPLTWAVESDPPTDRWRDTVLG